MALEQDTESAARQAARQAGGQGLRAVALQVEGMTCQHCERSVAEGLRAVGATGVRVDHSTGLAHLSAGDHVSEQALLDAVADAGYSARPRRLPPSAA